MEKFFRAVSNINESNLYNHSIKFPTLSLEDIESNFTIDEKRDEFNKDQNIDNLIMCAGDHSYIDNYIAKYRDNIQSFNSEKKKVIMIIFIKILINIELGDKLGFKNNFDLLFDNDLFPLNPTHTIYYDFIRKMNNLIYILFSNIDNDLRQVFLSTLKTFWEKNGEEWIYNFFPFFIQIYKNSSKPLYETFINSEFFSSNFLSLAETNKFLFFFASKIINSNTLLSFKNSTILNYIDNYSQNHDYLVSLMDWLSNGLIQFSKSSEEFGEIQTITDRLIALFLSMTLKEDLNDAQIDYLLESMKKPFLNLNSFYYQNPDLINNLLTNFSSLCVSKSETYFEYINFLSEMNKKLEVFDNFSFNQLFDNLKKRHMEKSEIENLWKFILKKDENNSSEQLTNEILNWRGIELLLAFIETDEFNIIEKLSKLVCIQSNLCEFQKANLSNFIIKRLPNIQNDKKIFQSYICILQSMVTSILTEKDLYGLIELAKQGNFLYSNEVLQLFLSMLTTDKSFNPTSFFRFDRPGQYLVCPLRKISNSHSICFYFRLIQPIESFTKSEIISLLNSEKIKFCSLYIENNVLKINLNKSDENKIYTIDTFSIEYDKWTFVEIMISSEHNRVTILFNNNEYICIDEIFPSTKFLDLFRKRDGKISIIMNRSREYAISIESSTFDYSDIFVFGKNFSNTNYYDLITNYNADLIDIFNFLSCNNNNKLNLIYSLYCTKKEGVTSNHCKYIKNLYNQENLNLNETEGVSFLGRTITDNTSIFDIKQSVDILKFLYPLFDIFKSSSENDLTKLMEIFELLNFTNTKQIEIFSILFNNVDLKYFNSSLIKRFSNLFDLLKPHRFKRQYFQSLIFNFEFVSKLPENLQVEFYNTALEISNVPEQYIEVKSFESLLFNIINYYSKKTESSEAAWLLMSKIFDPNNPNDLVSIITTSMKNFTSYITSKCVNILIDTITKIEENSLYTTKILYSLSVYLTSLDNVEIQILGIKLFCLVERYFNIEEKTKNMEQPINSSQYVYQMILSTYVNHSTEEFDNMTKTIFNFFVPNFIKQGNEEPQLKLINTESTEYSYESNNVISIKNLNIFPLLVYFCSFCSIDCTKELIDSLNTNISELTSLLDLNSWHFWIINFLFQYIRENKALNDEKDLLVFLNPLIELFKFEVSHHSSTEKINEFFIFLNIYGNRLKFNYRQIELLIIIELLTFYKNTNSKKEIEILYPIVYSSLQIEIKNNSFEFCSEEDKYSDKNEDTNQKFLLDLFTKPYFNNFQFTLQKPTYLNNQFLRNLLIETVINIEGKLQINFKFFDKNDAYFLTSFILIDYIKENSDNSSDQLINRYKELISNLQKENSKQYKKCGDILAKLTNNDFVSNQQNQFLSKYFQDSKINREEEINKTTQLLVKDFQDSKITDQIISKPKEICVCLLKTEQEFNDFYQKKFEIYDSLRYLILGKQKMRNERIFRSLNNVKSRNTIDMKYKVLNQFSIQGSRILMSINNSFSSNFDKDLKKYENKIIHSYHLSLINKKIRSINCRLMKFAEMFDGILYIFDDRLIFLSLLKNIEIEYYTILFILNRFYSDDKGYQGCEIFTSNYKSYYFIFDKERDAFYKLLPDYNHYLKILANKYNQDSEKQVDLNIDKTLKFDFFGQLRKICNSYYQNNDSMYIFNKLNLASKWQNFTISNFDYIYYLNLLSNRSYHIPSRYLYFPNLLKSFDTETINLEDENIYRDLSIPTILNFNDQKIYLPLSFCPNNDHSISDILIRVEPFTTHRAFINEKPDDRVFSNARVLWEKSQALELIPEIFTFPFYLINENKMIIIGINGGEDKNVEDVILPKWAKNNFTFTFCQRLMLESNFVSKNLPKWFDITFGKNQNKYKGKELFVVSRASLVGCLPDKLYKNSKHLHRDLSKAPFISLLKDNQRLNSLKENLKNCNKIINMVKEFIYYESNDSLLIADISQSPLLISPVPKGTGELLAVSKPLNLAIFGNKFDDYLTAINLQQKSILFCCHIKARILCVKSVGGRYLLTGGSDSVIRVWDMMHNFMLVSSSCFHEDEIVAISGNRNIGVVASIDRSMNLAITTLTSQKLLAFVKLEKEDFVPIIQVTKSGLFIVAQKNHLLFLDSRGREIKRIDINNSLVSSLAHSSSHTVCEDKLFIFNMNVYYDFNTREFLIVGLNSGEIFVVDLTIFNIIANYSIKNELCHYRSWPFCTIKNCRAALLFDDKKFHAILFEEFISNKIVNDENPGTEVEIKIMDDICL